MLIEYENQWRTVKCVWTAFQGNSKGYIASIQRRSGKIIADLYFVYTADFEGFLIEKKDVPYDRIYTSQYLFNKIM